ncbi:hypothetical protein GYMLUDRAFT_470729 [Collybiopsis luxurians FD-317 M1]|uniref:Uncharacterized protein n=1 Tax=Collybiopsis luxurians FD-317 M1 TaxID=944289 RepID=A0A0D0B805_9AGAR|nr:hypothetical protein GYMLUDRAFT_470729 [Collybiopsis luxurians FD-317 M1]
MLNFLEWCSCQTLSYTCSSGSCTMIIVKWCRSSGCEECCTCLALIYMRSTHGERAAQLLRLCCSNNSLKSKIHALYSYYPPREHTDIVSGHQRLGASQYSYCTHFLHISE